MHLDPLKNTSERSNNSNRDNSFISDSIIESLPQRNLEDFKNQNRQVNEPGQLQSMINNSPRQVAQRQVLDALFGGATQLQKSPEEEQPLQGKENKTGLPDHLKAGTENLSGMSMDEVKVHYNSAKPAQLNALAYAQGNDIHVGPGQEQHLPHEAWHVVQQRQGRVQPTMQMKGTGINNSPALEDEADKMGDKALKNGFENRVPLVANSGSNSNVVQKYQIEGPYNINDPVHENVTLFSLIEAGLVDKDAKFSDKEIWEYNRGVIWNDDPEGLLFDDNQKKNKDFSSGIVWKNHFDEGKEKATKGESIGVQDSLTARSHFGDLQFLHGMGTDGEKAATTKEKIMVWAEFTYKVATGVIPDSTVIMAVPVPGIPALFSSEAVKKLTIRQFFHVHKNGSTEQRAIGSLLHLLQDSYAEGHVNRESLADNKKGNIESFHSYTHQDGHKHDEKDRFQEGDTMEEKLKKVPGAMDAVKMGGKLLKYYSQKEKWETVKEFLDITVFNLKDPDKVADTGSEFEKDHDH